MAETSTGFAPLCNKWLAKVWRIEWGEIFSIRLAGVDAPEKNQAFGQRAKEFTSEKVFGKGVKVLVSEKDRFG
jgi:endonuclease YncB( thermonuclease family)